MDVVHRIQEWPRSQMLFSRQETLNSGEDEKRVAENHPLLGGHSELLFELLPDLRPQLQALACKGFWAYEFAFVQVFF